MDQNYFVCLSLVLFSAFSSLLGYHLALLRFVLNGIKQLSIWLVTKITTAMFWF